MIIIYVQPLVDVQYLVCFVTVLLVLLAQLAVAFPCLFSQAQLAVAEGLPADELVFYCGGKPLSDGDVLSNCSNLATLDVELRLLGGEV